MFYFDSSGTNFFIHSLFSLKLYVKIKDEQILLLSQLSFALPHSSVLFFTGKANGGKRRNKTNRKQNIKGVLSKTKMERFYSKRGLFSSHFSWGGAETSLQSTKILLPEYIQNSYFRYYSDRCKRSEVFFTGIR